MDDFRVLTFDVIFGVIFFVIFVIFVISERDGNRVVHSLIERPTDKDILHWKHNIIGSLNDDKTSTFKQDLINVRNKRIAFTRQDNVGGHGDRKIGKKGYTKDKEFFFFSNFIFFFFCIFI